MIYNIGEYTYMSSYHEGKKGYVNKFEKSLKSPFLNVLHNHLPGIKHEHEKEPEINDSDIAVNDKIELSLAVVSASDASDSDAGNNSGV